MKTLGVSLRVSYLVYDHNAHHSGEYVSWWVKQELRVWVVVAALAPVALGWGAAQDAVDENKEMVQRSMAAGLDWNAVDVRSGSSVPNAQSSYSESPSMSRRAQHARHA